ncbi:hypothetical protein B0T19DRAFT_401035 [Cercophora scortea]|uniref:C2H2-type domain-containing protein n=1 Tax=Cercophora scortea TaxID=314031 RepID=A0AAE0INF7_9PEZI|nr:hypothetical protein B0T19DRAFT_401035 [Cercophora scortea]
MTFARDFSVSSSYGADYDGLHPLQAEDGLYPLLVQDGLQVAVEALQAPFGLDVSFDKEALHPTQSPTSFAPETAQYPTLVYQTWLSQTFPTHDSSWNKDKCPMPTCDERFDNIQSLLIHLEKHCKVLKHWECWDCSRAQQPSTTPSQRHCRWCRTKHFLDGLAKRVSSTGSSLRKSLSLRKHSPKSSSSEHWDDVDCDSPVLSIPSRMSSASYSSPNPKGKQNDGDWLAPLPPPPVELRTTFGSPSSSFQGLRGVHQTRQHIPQADAIPAAPVELDARLPVELPTTESFSSFERQNTEAVKDTGAESPSGYATPAKSWTAVSAIRKEYYSRSTSPELQLCFAYLGLAMAAIVKDHDDTGMMYAGLHQEMSAFISAEGEIGFGSLSARLRPIMEQFLNVLAVFIPRATHGSGLQPTSQTDVALQFMTSELQSRKSYLESRFSQNPSQPPRSDSEHRQQTWSSSSSTLFDTEAPDVSPTANVSNEKNPPQEIPSPDLPSGRKHGISRQAGVKKCRPKSDSDSEPVCCATCEYNPASGPDQHKKMARHNKTGSHLRKTQQDVGSQEEFPCDFVNHKGIKCGGSYNRRDNLRQHQRLVHGLILRREVQDPSGDEVDPQTMQSSAPKRRRTTRTGMGELGDELDPRTMQRPAPKRRRTTRTGMVEAGELTRSGS